MDPMDGSKINRNQLYKCATEGDEDILSKMDKFLEKAGGHKNIMTELKEDGRFHSSNNASLDDYQESSGVNPESRNKNKHSDVACFWREPNSPVWTEENHHELRFEENEIKDIITSLNDTQNLVCRLKTRLSTGNSKN